MSRPIEAGCRAVIVCATPNDPDNGKVVRVIALEALEGEHTINGGEGRLWEIDTVIIYFGLNDKPNGRCGYLCPESILRRIDDDHDIIAWDDERSVWKPDSLKVKS